MEAEEKKKYSITYRQFVSGNHYNDVTNLTYSGCTDIVLDATWLSFKFNGKCRHIPTSNVVIIEEQDA